jgi:hypothetical protein
MEMRASGYVVGNGIAHTAYAWALGAGLVATAGCVAGEPRPPKCADSEQPVITSNVFDHTASKPAGDTWSCEASCPAGQKRVVAYADAEPALRLGVFNGQWQKRYEYQCVPECAEGEKLERAVATSDSVGAHYRYSCFNVAKREAAEVAESERAEAGALAAATADRERRDANREVRAREHPGAACMENCIDVARQCTRECKQRRCNSPTECLKTGGYPVCMQPCQEMVDACTAGCQGLPP